MRRVSQAIAIIAALVLCVGCQTVSDPYPPQSAVNFEITDTAVATQRTPLPAPQIAIWTVDEASIHDLTGYSGTYSFLRSGACTYQLNALAPFPFSASCRSSGLTVAPDVASTGVLRLEVSRLELRAAARPDLSAGGDPDGDGVPNASDNCPIVYNPDQANVNASAESVKVGDACSKLTGGTPPEPTIADQDLDGSRDVVDNCLWYDSRPLPAGTETPVDSNKDGIGDACERIAPVVLPAGHLTLECNVTFTPKPGRPSIFRIDFGRSGVLTCDAGFTGCTLDASAIQAELSGSTTTFPCVTVP